MNLHTDIPTRAEIDWVLTTRHPASVALYLPTDPVSSGQAERIELRNLAAEARGQLEEAGEAKRDIDAVIGAVEELAEDDGFWRFQARSLAVFATPDSFTTFRLPNRLTAMAAVCDRFHLKPLRKPFEPTQHDLMAAQRLFPPNFLHETWRDYLYWDVELEK